MKKYTDKERLDWITEKYQAHNIELFHGSLCLTTDLGLSGTKYKYSEDDDRDVRIMIDKLISVEKHYKIDKKLDKI